MDTLEDKKSQYFDCQSSWDDLLHSNHAAEMLSARRCTTLDRPEAEVAMLERSLYESCLISYRRAFNGGQPVIKHQGRGRFRLDNDALKQLLAKKFDTHEMAYHAAGKIVAHQTTGNGVFPIDNCGVSETEGPLIGITRTIDLRIIAGLRDTCEILIPHLAKLTTDLAEEISGLEAAS